MQIEVTGGVFAQVVANARAPYRTLLEVIGSDGVLTAESGFSVDRPVEVVHRKNGQVVSSATFDNVDGYVRMLDGFAAAVRGGAEFLATGEDGVLNMRAGWMRLIRAGGVGCGSRELRGRGRPTC